MPPATRFPDGDARASRRDPFAPHKCQQVQHAGMPQPGSSRRRPPAATPLPYRRLVIPLLLFFVEALATSVVLPLTPFVVRHHVQHDDMVGYYSGCMNAAFVAGQALASIVWVALSERCGRRSVLLSCLVLTGGPASFFGAAPTLLIAFIARFAQGLASGTSVVGKAYVADVTDATNEDSRLRNRRRRLRRRFRGRAPGRRFSCNAADLRRALCRGSNFFCSRLRGGARDTRAEHGLRSSG